MPPLAAEGKPFLPALAGLPPRQKKGGSPGQAASRVPGERRVPARRRKAGTFVFYPVKGKPQRAKNVAATSKICLEAG